MHLFSLFPVVSSSWLEFFQFLIASFLIPFLSNCLDLSAVLIRQFRLFRPSAIGMSDQVELTGVFYNLTGLA